MDLDWDGCVNAREVSGLRPGSVVRMESPHRLTGAGWEQARKYGLRTLVDLRNDDEYDSVERPGWVRTIRIPLEPVGTPFFEHWTAIDGLASPLSYPAMLTEYGSRVLSVISTIIDAPPGAVAVHCSAGRDRTGLVSLVLQTVAGLSVAEISADHHLSLERLQPWYDELGIVNQVTRMAEFLGTHDTTHAEAIAAAVAAARLLRIPEDQLHRLRVRLLPAPDAGSPPAPAHTPG
ncbi:tyrosine-protein phosphatase [Pseudonocardiaceae bacterium YIM PH 21723]|nr:tyrosine-protein phosphatase [Pseudonocardiaceae bacterium YIM PH 21723]